MSTLAPVMKRQSSEARNTRECGHVLGRAEARPRRARSHVRLLLELGVGRALARREDLAGRDRVADDAVLGEVDRDLAREVDDRALHGRVRDVAGRADQAVLRRHVDHAAAHVAARLLRQHLPHRAPAAEERPAQPDVEDDVPVGLAGLEQALRVRARDHRVVDHDVEPALAELQRSLDQPVDVAGARDVGLDEARDAAGLGDQAFRRHAADVQRLALHVADHDARALGGEGHAHRAPEPRGGAGDDDRAIREPRHAADGRARRDRPRHPPTGLAGICRSREDGPWEPMSQLDDDALLASEAALHSALASIPAVSVIVVDHAVRIRALHGSALQRHGYVHAQMLGKRVEEAMPGPVSERLTPLFRQALAGQTTTIHQRSEDATAFYESTFSPVRVSGRVVAATMTSRDITAQKLAEEKLSEANARLEAVLDHSPMAIYMRDLDQRWIVANAETCAIMGKRARGAHRPADGRGLRAGGVRGARGERPPGHARRRRRQLRRDRPGCAHEHTRHVWSIKFPIRDAGGAVVGLGGVSLDVTDRERDARELAAARELFERMFTSALVGMLVSRANADGTTEVIQCNPAFAPHARTRPAPICSAGGAAEIVHPDDMPERRRMLDEVLAGRAASGEIRFKHLDGNDIHALAAASLTHDADGGLLILLQAVDISERKVLEARLQHLADHDALTGLYTRRRFEEELAREVSRSRRHKRVGDAARARSRRLQAGQRQLRPLDRGRRPGRRHRCVASEPARGRHARPHGRRRVRGDPARHRCRREPDRRREGRRARTRPRACRARQAPCRGDRLVGITARARRA